MLKQPILDCTQRQSLQATPSSSGRHIGRAAYLESGTMPKGTFVDSTCGPASAYGSFTPFRDGESSVTTHGLMSLLKRGGIQASGDRSAWMKSSAWSIGLLSRIRVGLRHADSGRSAPRPDGTRFAAAEAAIWQHRRYRYG